MMIAAEADSAGVRPGGMRGGGACFEVMDAPGKAQAASWGAGARCSSSSRAGLPGRGMCAACSSRRAAHSGIQYAAAWKAAARLRWYLPTGAARAAPSPDWRGRSRRRCAAGCRAGRAPCGCGPPRGSHPCWGGTRTWPSLQTLRTPRACARTAHGRGSAACGTRSGAAGGGRVRAPPPGTTARRQDRARAGHGRAGLGKDAAGAGGHPRRAAQGQGPLRGRARLGPDADRPCQHGGDRRQRELDRSRRRVQRPGACLHPGRYSQLESDQARDRPRLGRRGRARRGAHARPSAGRRTGARDHLGVHGGRRRSGRVGRLLRGIAARGPYRGRLPARQPRRRAARAGRRGGMGPLHCRAGRPARAGVRGAQGRAGVAGPVQGCRLRRRPRARAGRRCETGRRGCRRGQARVHGGDPRPARHGPAAGRVRPAHNAKAAPRPHVGRVVGEARAARGPVGGPPCGGRRGRGRRSGRPAVAAP